MDFDIEPDATLFQSPVLNGTFNNVVANTATNPNQNLDVSNTFSVSANFQPNLAPEPVSQTVIYNPDLIQGVDNATMLPQIQPDVSANDSLFGAFCSITEEFTQDIAELSQSVGMGKQVSIGPVQVDQELTMQQKTWAPSPSSNMMP